jgi:colanic acid/amylovoran biosynthesis protein
MLIEIYGTGLENKGGQLMMEAVIRRLGPLGATFCMNPRLDAPVSQLVPLGVKPLMPPTGNGRAKSLPMQLRLAETASKRLPASVARLYEAVRRHEVEALVDVSGYAFGDHVPALNIKLLSVRAAFHKKKGRPVVMMPQMLGPFEKQDVAEAMRELLPSVDLLYVRDKLSMEHLKKCVGSAGLPASVRFAPDITIFEKPTDSDRERARELVPENYVGLVPNIRMFDRGDGSWRPIYLDRLAAAGRLAMQQDVPVRIIVHETKGDDADLGVQLKAKLGGDVQIVNAHEPLVLKAMIARARLLVASRFHSIVAALASDVPAVAIGWSHKYEALLSDFGVSELVHRSTDDERHLLDHVSTLLTDDGLQAKRDMIRQHRQALETPAEQMWQEIAFLLELH